MRTNNLSAALITVVGWVFASPCSVDAQAGLVLRRSHGLDGDITRIDCLVFSQNGKHVAFNSDKSIYVVDLVTRRERKLKVRANATNLMLLADGKTVVFTEKRNLRFWDSAADADMMTLKSHQEPVQSVSATPDGKWLATVGMFPERLVCIWDPNTGGCVKQIKLSDPLPMSVALSPDGQTVAVSHPHFISVWNVKEGAMIRKLHHGRPANALTYSHDGRFLSVQHPGGVLIWDMLSVDDKAKPTIDFKVTECAAGFISPSGQLVATVTREGTIQLWSVKSQKELLRIEGSNYRPSFAPDSKSLLFATGLRPLGVEIALRDVSILKE